MSGKLTIDSLAILMCNLLTGRSPGIACRGFLHHAVQISGETADVAWPEQVTVNVRSKLDRLQVVSHWPFSH